MGERGGGHAAKDHGQEWIPGRCSRDLALMVHALPSEAPGRPTTSNFNINIYIFHLTELNKLLVWTTKLIWTYCDLNGNQVTLLSRKSQQTHHIYNKSLEARIIEVTRVDVTQLKNATASAPTTLPAQQIMNLKIIVTIINTWDAL